MRGGALVWVGAMVLLLAQPVGACHAAIGYRAGAVLADDGPISAELWFGPGGSLTYPCEGDLRVSIVLDPLGAAAVEEVPAHLAMVASVPPFERCALGTCRDVAQAAAFTLTALAGPEVLDLAGVGLFATEYSKHLEMVGTYRGQQAAFVIFIP